MRLLGQDDPDTGGGEHLADQLGRELGADRYIGRAGCEHRRLGEHARDAARHKRSDHRAGRAALADVVGELVYPGEELGVSESAAAAAYR